MLRSLKDKLKFQLGLAAVEVTASSSGTGIDTQELMALTFIVNAGAEAGNALSGSHKLAIVVQHADVDVDGSYAACVDADIYDAEDGANGIAKNLDATDDASAVHKVSYRGTKRWVRLRLVETGTVDIPIAIVAIGMPKIQPPA